MKTIITRIFTLALCLGSFTAKPSNSPEKELNTETEKVIKGNFKHLSVRGQKVEVLFSTNENGNVNFVLAKTDDRILKKEIEKRFYKMNFKKLKQNGVNSVTINFKTL